MPGRTFASLLAFSAFLTTAAFAAGGPGVDVELNKLEQLEDECRAYLVLENRSEAAFEALKLDLVMFDAEGVVAKRLAVELAPLPAGKTRLKAFDIASLPCADLGRVLLNEVMACADGTGGRDDCLELIAVSARGEVGFVK